MVLIKVTGCADQGEELYENAVEGEVGADDTDDIYDEVYNHQSDLCRGTNSSASSSKQLTPAMIIISKS